MMIEEKRLLDCIWRTTSKLIQFVSESMNNQLLHSDIEDAEHCIAAKYTLYSYSISFLCIKLKMVCANKTYKISFTHYALHNHNFLLYQTIFLTR